MAYTKCKPFNVLIHVIFFYFGLAGFVKEEDACHMAFREPGYEVGEHLEA